MAKDKTFARGPDGELYVLSKNNIATQKLTAQEKKAVTDILKAAQTKVETDVQAALQTSVGSGVNLNVADFPEL